MTDKQITSEMERVVTKLLPKILKDNVNNIRVGTITSWNAAAKTVSVLMSTGNIINNIKYQQGVTEVIIGSQALLISPDAFVGINIKAIIF